MTRRHVLFGATAIAANALAAACGGGSSATDTPKPVATVAPPIPATAAATATAIPVATATPIPPTPAPTATAAATASLLTPTPFVAQYVPTPTPFISVPTVAETFATPTGTPTTPLIVFAGDSGTYGNGVKRTETYPAQTMALLAPAKYDAVNLGVNGRLISRLNDQAATIIDPLYAASRSKNIVVLYSPGSGDLGTGTSGEETYATVVSFCQGRRSVGFKVVVVTLLPRTGAFGRGVTKEEFETVRQSVNASIRKNLASFADALADVGADPTLGAVDTTADREYYLSDRIHPTGKGYSIVAGLVKAAILTL